MTPLAFLLSIVLSLAPSSDEPFAELTLPDALAEAGKSEKVVLVDWFTTWCGPCKKLDQETWPDPKVRAWVGEHAIALKIDAEKDAKTAARHGVRAYPTLLFLRPDGSEIGRLVGFKSAEDFVREASDLLASKGPVDVARERLEAAGGNDPMLRQDLGEELARAGRHAEALEHFLWCWDHGLEHSWAFVGVRSSFLLSEIAELGETYPPAVEALRERRDACERALLDGSIDLRTALDLASLDERLGLLEKTLAVYDTLLAREDLTASQRTSVRRAMFDAVADLLLEARRYEDLLEGLGDPRKVLARDLWKVRAFRKNEVELLGKEQADALHERSLERIVAENARSYEALLGVGRVEDARSLAEELVAVRPSATAATVALLRRHAETAGAQEEAELLLEREREARAAEPADEPFANLTLPDALAEAGKSEKVVMVDWFTTWCGPCKKLDQETWPDPKVRAWLGEHAIALKIDAEKDAKTAARHGVRAYPTLLFLRPDGSEIGRLVGFKSAEDFVAAASDLLAGKSPVETAREELEAAGGNDPMLRQDLGEELARAGRHAEALEHFLWCWDHGLEHSSSFVGVRSSFLLSAIAELGRTYPPALEALRERREAYASALLTGPIDSRTASDLASLDQRLGQREKTLAVHDAVLAREDLTPEQRDAARTGLFDAVADLLLDAQRYEDVLAAVGDHRKALETGLQMIRTFSDGQEEGEQTEMLRMMRSRVVTENARTYEALLGVGRLEEARALAEELIALQPRATTVARLRRHAGSAGAEEEAELLREREREMRAEERERRRRER